MYRGVNQYIYIYGKPETERRYWLISKYLIPIAKPKRVPKRNIQLWIKVSHQKLLKNKFYSKRFGADIYHSIWRSHANLW